MKLATDDAQSSDEGTNVKGGSLDYPVGHVNGGSAQRA